MPQRRPGSADGCAAHLRDYMRNRLAMDLLRHGENFAMNLLCPGAFYVVGGDNRTVQGQRRNVTPLGVRATSKNARHIKHEGLH